MTSERRGRWHPSPEQVELDRPSPSCRSRRQPCAASQAQAMAVACLARRRDSSFGVFPDQGRGQGRACRGGQAPSGRDVFEGACVLS
jgi:hypothetical protein